MKTAKQGALIYFFGVWCSVMMMYAVKGHFQMLFSGRTLPWFLVATIFLAATSLLMYIACTQLRGKYRKLLPVLWVTLPLLVIAIYMQIAFQAISGHTHGFGYVSGLGSAKKVWLLISAISVFWSAVSYWFKIRKSSST